MTIVPRPDDSKLFVEFYFDVDKISFVTEHKFTPATAMSFVKLGNSDPTKEELMQQLSSMYGVQVKELEYYIHSSDIVPAKNYIYNGRDEVNLEDSLRRAKEAAHNIEQGFNDLQDDHSWHNAVMFYNARHGKDDNHMPSPYDIFLDNLEDYTRAFKDRATHLRDHKHVWPSWEELGNYESRCKVCGMSGDI